MIETLNSPDASVQHHTNSFDTYRRQIRSIRKNASLNTGRQLDEVLLELNIHQESAIRVGSPTLASKYLGLMARVYFLRGKTELMQSVLNEALAIDSQCTIANLQLGEFHFTRAERMLGKGDQRVEFERAAKHFDMVYQNGDDDGARNNAGYQLALVSEKLEDNSRVIDLRSWLLDRVVDSDLRKKIRLLIHRCVQSWPTAVLPSF